MAYVGIALALVLFVIALAGEAMLWRLPAFNLLRKNAKRLHDLSLVNFKRVEPTPRTFGAAFHLRLSEFLELPPSSTDSPQILLTLKESAAIHFVKEEIIEKTLGEIRFNASAILGVGFIGFALVFCLDPTAQKALEKGFSIHTLMVAMETMMSWHTILFVEIVLIFVGLVSIVQGFRLVKHCNDIAEHKFPK